MNGTGNTALADAGSVLLLDSLGELAGSIGSRMPFLSADHLFRAAGTIFLNPPPSGRFRSMVLLWKIFARWPRIS